MRTIAVVNKKNVKDYSKENHDKKAKAKEFEIGDKVLVFAPNVTGKPSEKFDD